MKSAEPVAAIHAQLTLAERRGQRIVTLVDPRVSREALRAYLANEKKAPDTLSGREREVLQLIAEGRSTKEIAATLSLSAKTVETHRARLMTKLDIQETAGLVRYAIRKGFIQP